MTYLLEFLQRCVDLVDNTVFGRAQLTKSAIDIRTLISFVLFAAFLFIGLGVVGSLESEFFEFGVWVVASTPLALIFIARHQRIGEMK